LTGKISVIGFGPGSKGDMTFRAAEAIENADIVMGYTTYIDILKKHFPQKKFESTGMMKEIDRCRMAVKAAEDGSSVAMVSSGDSGIYGMAGIMYQIADDMKSSAEIEVIPGITAASSAAAILGAPLMHDTAIISLSDWLTPWDLIEKRLNAASSSDMIIALYNPKSKSRPDLLEKAMKIISANQSPDTVVGMVKNIGRENEESTVTTIKDFDFDKVDMFTTVIVGNSKTFISKGKMITPRGYDLK
jgi:precorrin-3B C17-methyltransferase